MGQRIIFLVFITPKITVPINFHFYMPDPELTAWYKSDKKFRAKGIPKKSRPVKPERSPNYPTIQESAISLLERFKADYPELRIRCIFADVLYGTKRL